MHAPKPTPLAAAFCLALLTAALTASEDPPRVFTTDVNLVLIPVSVTDYRDQPFPNLYKEDFRLFEDGAEQSITHFYREEAPISLIIVFDSSGSMVPLVKKSVAAVVEAFKNTVRGDEFSLVRFNRTAELASPFTANPDGIESQLRLVQAKGRTALYDAIFLALKQAKSARNPRKAMLILSDGRDNASRHRALEIQHLVREADVRIYAAGIFDFIPLLEVITRESGGRMYAVSDINEIRRAVAAIHAELRHQYVIGYTPPGPRANGKYRRVTVRVHNPPGVSELRVTWRRGYYTPVD